jgi:hypothetical protein
MSLIGLERVLAAVLFGELVALLFLALASAGHAAAIRFPSKSPFGEHTQRRAGARFHREVIRARGQAGALGLGLLVLVLASAAGWLVLPWELPFEAEWWTRYLLILHVAGLLGLLVAHGWRINARLVAARAAWHANLAIGHLCQRFALAGHRVFHDVTINGLIVDHVLVGSRGVFLINVVVRPRQRGNKDESVKLLPIERQIDLGGKREFEAVFDATRRITESGRLLADLLGHAQRPLSALVTPGWKAEPTTEGEHYLFDLTNLATLLSWAKPANGLLDQDIVKVHDFLQEHCKDPRPV